MNIIKLTIAAATVTVGLAASASAMPVGNIGALHVDGAQPEQVRLVCNRHGRCYNTRRSRYYAPRYGYGYGPGYGYYPPAYSYGPSFGFGYGGGWRHGRRW